MSSKSLHIPVTESPERETADDSVRNENVRQMTFSFIIRCCSETSQSQIPVPCPCLQQIQRKRFPLSGAHVYPG